MSHAIVTIDADPPITNMDASTILNHVFKHPQVPAENEEIDSDTTEDLDDGDIETENEDDFDYRSLRGTVNILNSA